MLYSDELVHHGIKGQKHGLRRYQYRDGSLTPEGKIRYGVNGEPSRKTRRIIKAKQKQADKRAKEKTKQKQAQQKQEQENLKTAEQIAAKKKQIAEEHSYAKLYEHRNLYSYSELKEAKVRMDLETDIKKAIPATVGKGEAFIARTQKYMKTATDFAEQGVKAYNAAAKVHNILFPDDKKWEVQEKKDKKKKKDEEDED